MVQFKVSLDILDPKNMKQIEREAVRIEKANLKLEKAKRAKGGIFAGDEAREALPSALLKKRRKEAASGLKGGRLDDSTDKLVGEKISAQVEEEKLNVTRTIMNALGIGGAKKAKLAKNSLVSGAGNPLGKQNEFLKLRDKVGKMENTQKAFAKSLTGNFNMIKGASGLTTPSGIFGAGMGIVGKVPHVAAVIAAAAMIYEKYESQYGGGGTKDTRKKILAEDVSDIGVEAQSDINSGRVLFLSNPMKNQGMPAGNSNTQFLRDGTRIHKLRKEGTYT